GCSPFRSSLRTVARIHQTQPLRFLHTSKNNGRCRHLLSTSARVEDVRASSAAARVSFCFLLCLRRLAGGTEAPGVRLRFGAMTWVDRGE
ncbi:hypothetical protein B0H12DRAFT_1137437, partial [Mycena haematopus]